MDRKQLGLTRSWFSATNVHKRVTLLGSAEQKLVKTAKVLNGLVLLAQ
ncbi:hypothetical protein Tco_0287893, partial [Tanacetum coccineum]